MVILRHVGVLSLGKVLGALYAFLGFIFGGLFSLISLAGALASNGRQGGEALFFGAGAVVIFPVLYGIIGFIAGVVAAALYNVLVSVVGGLELEFDHPTRSTSPLSNY